MEKGPERGPLGAAWEPRAPWLGRAPAPLDGCVHPAPHSLWAQTREQFCPGEAGRTCLCLCGPPSPSRGCRSPTAVSPGTFSASLLCGPPGPPAAPSACQRSPGWGPSCPRFPGTPGPPLPSGPTHPGAPHPTGAPTSPFPSVFRPSSPPPSRHWFPKHAPHVTHCASPTCLVSFLCSPHRERKLHEGRSFVCFVRFEPPTPRTVLERVGE